MEYGDVESFLKSVSAVEIGNQTVKGTFASATDATKTVEFDFQLEWHNPTTIIK